MKLEVDQSVKVEQLNRDTVIGVSNDIQFAAVLPSRVKRRLQRSFRRSRRPKLFR